MAAERRINQLVVSNTEVAMHISEKEVSRRQLRLAFDDMQHSSGIARYWYEEQLTQMRARGRQNVCRLPTSLH
eukprot:11159529-Lingulodinium_polyedra.AAC.1